MPWLLDTPVSVGALDTSGYTHVDIIDFGYHGRGPYLSVSWEWGRVVDGLWVGGFCPLGCTTTVNIDNEDYGELVTTHEPGQGELTYAAVKRALYEWLAEHDFIGAGTVV